MISFLKRWWMWIVALVVIAGAGGYYYMLSSAPTVSVVQPEVQAVEAVITEDATVIPASKSAVAAVRGGRLSELLVEVGDQVQAGDVIARIDKTDESLSVQALEARLAAARAEYNRARQGATKAELDAAKARIEAAEAQVRALEQEVQQARLAYIQGNLSANEYQRVAENKNAAVADAQAARAQFEQLQTGADEETLRRLRAQIDEVQAQVAQARLDVERAELLAPMTGTILERSVEKGMVLQPGTTVAVVGDTTRLQVEAYVLAADSVLVEPGQTARITGDVLQGETVEGTVRSVSSVAVTRASELGVLQERVRVVAEPSDTTVLHVGFGLDLHIVVESVENALTVPTEAVFHEDDTAYVLVVVDGTLERRQIELGVRGENRIQVTSGLSESDRVVLNPAEDLDEGTRVQVK